VSTRVSPTEQLRAEIDDLFGQSDEERQLGGTFGLPPRNRTTVTQLLG
jgi:hypothetical protein